MPGILPADVPAAVTAGGRTAEEETHTHTPSETQAGPSRCVNEAVRGLSQFGSHGAALGGLGQCEQ